MDGARRVIPDGAVAVAGGLIAAVGTRAEVEAAHTAPRRIDARGKAILPGLIDGHAHAGHGLVKTMGSGDSAAWSEACRIIYTLASPPEFWRAEAAAGRARTAEVRHHHIGDAAGRRRFDRARGRPGAWRRACGGRQRHRHPPHHGAGPDAPALPAALSRRGRHACATCPSNSRPRPSPQLVERHHGTRPHRLRHADAGLSRGDARSRQGGRDREAGPRHPRHRHARPARCSTRMATAAAASRWRTACSACSAPMPGCRIAPT